MLSAHRARRVVAVAGIAGLGATLTVTTAHAASAQALPRTAPMMAQPDAAAPDDTATDTTETPAAPASAPAAAPAPASAASTYTVVAGDTLSLIAQAKSIPGDWQALYELNRDQLTDGPDWIDIGQVLKLAGAAPAPKTDTGATTTPRTPKPSSSASSTSSKLTVDTPTRPQTQTKTQTQTQAARTGASTTVPSTAATSSKAATAIAFAKAQLGKPYVYGGDGPDAYDCSGLVQAAWQAAGVSLPRVTNAQFADGNRVSTSNLQPGDLVFYYSGISHVGIYIGDGKIIHAPNPSTVVKVADVDSMPIAGATRPA
jgi:cell wall-associated NlpC family hydrolase